MPANQEGAKTDDARQRWLELHDSDVAAVDSFDDSIVVRFSGAIVHVPHAVSGGSGDVYVHEAELYFEQTSARPTSELAKGWISDGFVRIGAELHDNVLPIPLQATGNIEAQLQFTSGAAIHIYAQAVRCTVREPGRWLEVFP